MVLILWGIFASYGIYRALRIIRFEYPRYLARPPEEQRFLGGFFAGFMMAMSCAAVQLWWLSSEHSNPILQITINNLVSMIGAGPLLFLSAAMWRDSIKGKWVKRQYKGQVFRQLRWRGFFLVIASLMSGLFVCALLRTILSFSTLKLVEYLISSSFTYIGIVTSAFFAFHYNRRPCKVGKRILVVVETGARNPVIRKRA